jgi:two-component system response regulator PilR (NtrC family)
MPRILIVDDDMFFRKVITKLLSGQGYEITAAQSGEEALQILQSQTFSLMISDVNMTPMDGMELLKKSRESYPAMGVIMLTGSDELEVAIEAMKKGAFDFLVKPFQLDELFAVVQRSLGYYNASPASKLLQTRLDMLEGLVAESDSMRKVCDMIRRIAPANVTVLLCGEKGTDKELIARALHYYSPQKDDAFIVFDCAALPAQLMDEKLFGVVKGVRAAGPKTGLFETVRCGLLLLDNIDAMPVGLQAKLLDVIQNRSGRDIGSDNAQESVRIIAASSEKLELLVEKGAFNENLYYRLSSLCIDIPPLRDRLEDIPLLIDQALRRDLKSIAGTPTLDPKAREILYNYAWPGDVCELQEIIRQTLSFAQNGVITKEMIPAKVVAAYEEGLRCGVITNRHEQYKGMSFKAFLHGKQGKFLNRSTNPPEK